MEPVEIVDEAHVTNEKRGGAVDAGRDTSGAGDDAVDAADPSLGVDDEQLVARRHERLDVANRKAVAEDDCARVRNLVEHGSHGGRLGERWRDLYIQ